MRRECPCCPGARPDYEPTGRLNEFGCTNCNRTVVIGRRPAKVGGPRQTRAVERVKTLLAKNYGVAPHDTDTYWAARGRVCLVATPKAWHDDSIFIWIGACGGIKISLIGLRKRGEREGRDA